MEHPNNYIGTAYQRSGDGFTPMDMTAAQGDGLELNLAFLKKGKPVFAATVECLPYLMDAGAKVLAESADTHLWLKIPNPKADPETLSMSGLHIRELRQQFAEARAEIDRLEREFGLLPLPSDGQSRPSPVAC